MSRAILEGVGPEIETFLGPEMATKETHVHKITKVPAFKWRMDLIILMGQLITQHLNIFGPK